MACADIRNKSSSTEPNKSHFFEGDRENCKGADLLEGSKLRLLAVSSFSKSE